MKQKKYQIKKEEDTKSNWPPEWADEDAQARHVDSGGNQNGFYGANEIAGRNKFEKIHRIDGNGHRRYLALLELKWDGGWCRLRNTSGSAYCCPGTS